MSDLKGTLLNFTRNLSKTSGDLVKTTKLSVNLAQEQEALKTLYTEIGKKVHEIYEYGGTLGQFFDEKYREIQTAERKINELKEEIGKIKGVKECPKCGKQVDKNAEFCPKCGLKLDGVPPLGTENPGRMIMPPAEPGAAPAVEPAPLPPEPEPPSELLPPIPELPPEAITAAPEPKSFCRVCGAENDPGTKFCLSCGRLL